MSPRTKGISRKLLWTATIGFLLVVLPASGVQADIVKLPAANFTNILWNDDADAIAGKVRNGSTDAGATNYELTLGVSSLGSGERYGIAQITWTYNHTYNFSFDYQSSTGAASFTLYDYDQALNKVQIATVSTTYNGVDGHLDYAGQGMNVLRLNLVGNTDADTGAFSATQITDLYVNGKHFGADWSSEGGSKDKFYGNEDYSFLSEIHVSGDFLFTADTPCTKNSPRLEVELLNYTPTPTPVPPSALLMGSGLLGLAALGFRRKTR